MLNDVDDAIREIRWAKQQPGLNGGVLLPGVSPDHPSVPALYDECYERLWAVCAELDVPINHHSGAGLPDYGMKPAGRAVQLVEIPIFSHRALWHLIFAGVFERHPTLKLVLTEQGTGWIPNGLASLDWFMGRMKKAGSAESMFGGEAAEKLSMLPSEYFARNCYVGASFIRPVEADLRHLVGIDRIMWGADYPHSEGTAPYTREALRASFAHAAADECRLMFGKTAADVYGFDLAYLARVAAEIGPVIDEIHHPLDQFPTDTHCGAFDREAIVRSW